MSSPERNADTEFNPKNPLGVIDHEAVCQEIRSGLIDTEGSVSEALGFEWLHQLKFDKAMCDTLVEIGAFILPPSITTEEAENSPKLRAYVGGATAALQTVDTISRTLGIESEAFRTVWRNNGFFRIPDLQAKVFEDRTIEEKYEAVADSVVLSGQMFLENMEDCYGALIDEVVDNYQGLLESNIFKSSFGYVLGSAQQAMARMFQELEARRILLESDFTDSFDAGVAYLQEEPIPVTFTSDDDIAESIDTNIFYGEDGGNVEAHLGMQIEKRLDENDEVVETLQTLALALYPTDKGDGVLDEQGEAFFYGSVLGLEYVENLCTNMKIDLATAHHRWRRHNVHSRLYNTEFLPERREDYIDTEVVKTLQKTQLSPGTYTLADKISHNMEHELDEAVAFKNGLQYTLESYKKTIKGCIDSKISARVKLAASAIDKDITALLAE